MCGRFTQPAPPQIIAQQFAITNPPLFTPHYSIAGMPWPILPKKQTKTSAQCAALRGFYTSTTIASNGM